MRSWRTSLVLQNSAFCVRPSKLQWELLSTATVVHALMSEINFRVSLSSHVA